MIQVTIREIMAASSTIPQLAALQMAAKPKYWIGRILDKVQSAQRDFEKERMAMVNALGHAVEFVKDEPEQLENGVTLGNSGGKWVPITDPEKLKQANVQFMVKPENQDDFDKKMSELFDKSIVIPFSPIHIEELKNSKGEMVDVPFDIIPVLWMFTLDDEAGE